MKEIGDAVALVFVVVTSGSSGLSPDRGVRVSAINCLEVSSKQTRGRSGSRGPCDPGVSSTSSVAATKCTLASGGITHCQLRCGLRTFFNVRPIVLSLAFSTMFSSTTFSSRRRRLQRVNPGAGEQAGAISFVSPAPSNIRGRAELGLNLRFGVASNPSSTSC